MNKNSSIRKTKQNRLMLYQTLLITGKNKLRFIKSKKASGLLRKSSIIYLLSNIPLIREILF